jgi:hypothetical protein
MPRWIGDMEWHFYKTGKKIIASLVVIGIPNIASAARTHRSGPSSFSVNE